MTSPESVRPFPPREGPGDRERLDRLRLIRTPNVGPATFRDLVRRFGTAGAAIEALPDLLRRSGSGRRRFAVPTLGEAERELDALARHGGLMVAPDEPDYPPFLRQVESPPPLLSVLGTTAVFRLPPVAIVGARNASLAGTKMARVLAAELGRAGFAVVSGLARGIDAAAHQGALATGTVAVLAGGLDRPYPPDNVPLSREIAARGGAVVTEMPLGWEPRAQDFPRRNRIIAGMSIGLVVVEAAHRSGSLISARLAGEMGRHVFAVPGSPLDPRAAGTNGLLKDGATLVTEAGDVVAALSSQLVTPAPMPVAVSEPPRELEIVDTDESGRAAVLRLLGPVPSSVDDLVAQAGVPAAEVAMALLELDLAGRLERHPGGRVSLAPRAD